ncbi:MAG TPA: hypothetical protein VGH43_04965 [Jatrophihabitans sp.]
MGILRAVGHGLVAGAAGTTALNAATYLDMVLRARPASEIPGKAVDLLVEKADRPIPGEGDDKDNRREATAALLGIATGLGVGAVAGLLGPALTRLPRAFAGLAVGGVAMAASDLPLTKLGLTDPKQWSTTDWASDAIPHAAYGLVTVAALRAMQHRT